MRSPLSNVRAPWRGSRALVGLRPGGLPGGWRAIWLAAWIIALASLAACGSSASVAPAPTHTPIAWATAAPGTVLFASDWSKGLDGWQASAGWTVRDGMLEMDGQDNRTLTIPYQPTVRDYAIEFSVQVVNEPKDGGFFQLHAAATPQANGYRAEVYRILTATPHINGDHPTAQVTIDPSEAQDPASIHPIDYEPHNTMTTYRVEVRENTVRFATEKATLSAGVASKTDPLSHGPLTIECGLAFLRFGPVRVVAL